MVEIFVGIYFYEPKKLHFADINFRELKKAFNFPYIKRKRKIRFLLHSFAFPNSNKKITWSIDENSPNSWKFVPAKISTIKVQYAKNLF